MSLTCSKCLSQIAVDPASGRVPPWCPRCGADRSAYASQPDSVVGVLREAASQRPAGGPSPVGNPAANSEPLSPWRQERSALPPQLADIPLEDLAALAPPPRRPKVGIFVPASAPLCLLGSLVVTSLSINKLNTYHRAKGEVVDLVCTRRTTRGDSIHPVVAYQVGGVGYRFQGQNSVGFFSGYRIGDTVEVLYPPDQPGEGSIHSFTTRCFFPTVGAPLAFSFSPPASY